MVPLGGVISQLDSTGKDRPLSFASRTLKGAELQYSVLEKEALAILFLLEKHKFILLGHKVAINSDHRPLANLFKKPHNNARHQHWVEGLLQYNIVDFQHIAGKSNFVADALSRAPPDESRQDLCAITRSQTRAQQMAQDTQNSNQLESETSPQGSKDSLPTVERTFPEATPQGQPGPVSDFECMRAVDDLDGCADEWSVKGLIRAQDRDDQWGPVKEYLRGNLAEFPAHVTMPKEQFLLEEEILYVSKVNAKRDTFEYKVVIPKSFITMTLNVCHNSPVSGHLGIQGTLHRLKSSYYFTGMDKAVTKFIALCHMCNCLKRHRLITPPARKWPTVQCKWDRVHIDLIGPLPQSFNNNKYIFVLVCALTRYTWLQALPDKSANAVAAALKDFVTTFSSPKEVISDNGKEFMNFVIKEFCELLKIEHSSICA